MAEKEEKGSVIAGAGGFILSLEHIGPLMLGAIIGGKHKNNKS